MHGGNDVAALSHRPQGTLDIGIEAVAPLLLFDSEPHAGERAKARCAQTLLDRITMPGGRQTLLIERCQQSSIEAGEAFGGNLGAPRFLDFEFRARAEIEADDLRSAGGNAAAEIVAGDNQVLAAFVDGAHDDVGMGMAGVVVIDRDPFETSIEVLFDLLHQSAREVFQVLVVLAVLW